MSIGEITQFVATLAAMTAALAAVRTAREMSKQSRLGTLPRLSPNERGFWLPMPGERSANAVVSSQMIPLVLKNFGRGPALNVQWQIAPPGADEQNAPVPRKHTHALMVQPGESVSVVCTTSADQHGKEVPETYELTIWYDDVLGNHYRSVFTRNGDRWQETFWSSKPEKERPPLVSPNTMGF